MGLSRQEYWSGLPRPPPGDLSDPRMEPESLTSPAMADIAVDATTCWVCGLTVAFPSGSLPVAMKQGPCLVTLLQVAKSCLTLCDPVDCSTLGFPFLPRLRLSHKL
ncbi:unnamed protein product [Rangifer tarandus platyrhynchus]|uniref:Uncharacterized protein n=2 Tax=Rangifer tarandus platyrhynchus TaxID=3082113 RepID=A0AC59YJT6_RANTA|nr:unnamed protein product [Rangifer tarandus platyrhynchus]